MVAELGATRALGVTGAVRCTGAAGAVHACGGCRAQVQVIASVLSLLNAIGAFGQTAPRTPDVHYTPTRHAVADAMLQLAGVTGDDIVYDLGSGDGRIVIIAAQKYGARGVGIEIDPKLVALARQNARDAEVAERVTFIEGDLFTADIAKATVVTMYLSASINRRLEPKLKRELQPGARIVSHQFGIGDWAPDKARRPDFSDIFLWIVR